MVFNYSDRGREILFEYNNEDLVSTSNILMMFTLKDIIIMMLALLMHIPFAHFLCNDFLTSLAN